MTPRSPDSTFALWPLVAFDALAVAGIVGLHTTLPKEVHPALMAVEFLAIAGVGAACAYAWWRAAGQDARREPSPDTAKVEAELATLRKETAENLRVLQDDLHKLGEAVMKRLAHKAESKPESEHFEALAGTVTDLAVSIAEARETLTGIAADLAETKSTVFELQAQADQQSDALRAFEHTVEKTQHFAETDTEPGVGPAPGALEKALAAGIAGSAVARLINGDTAAPKPADEASRPTAPAVAEEAPSPVPPLSSDDLEDAFDDESLPGDEFDGETLPEEDWDILSPEEIGPEVGVGEAVEPLAVSPEAAESALTDDDADDTDDWLSCGLEDDPDQDDEESQPPTTSEPSQPVLLALDDETEAKKKPRRPGKHDTALIAHVMIGIGNKPFLRGFGPGLSSNKGVPMEYVDVGRWQWVCPEAGSPVTVTLWRNDEIPAEGPAISVPSGMTLEIHPQFPH